MKLPFFKRWVHKYFGSASRSQVAPLARRTKAFRLCLEPLEDRIVPSTLAVTNPLDVAVAGEMSLRDALVTANTDAAAGVSDTIVFDPGLGSATINLTQGPLVLSGAGTGTITIDGSAPSTPLTIDGTQITGGIFQVESGVHAAIENLSIQNGSTQAGDGGAILNVGTLSVANVNFTGNNAVSGGAIENQGTLTLSNCAFAGNNANGANGLGGAIDNTGTATVSDSTFSNNTAFTGGAIANEGTLTVSNTTFNGNTADGSGGAIDSSSGSFTLTGSYFSADEAAASGGAIENQAILNTSSSTFTGDGAGVNGSAIDNSGAVIASTAVISGNSPTGNGASAIDNHGGSVQLSDATVADNAGGGLANTAGTMTLTNVTVAGNSNGAITNGGSLTLHDTTVSANSDGSAIVNSGGTLTLQNSIVAGNTNSGTSGDIAGVITTDAGFNLLGTATNNATTDPHPGPHDLFSDSPGLATLGNYGGPIQTMALLAGSLASGAGNPSGAPATDQRGLPRVINNSLDIGAFQTQPPTLAFTTLGQTFSAGQTTSITVELQDLDGNPIPAGMGGVTLTLASSSNGASFFDSFGNALPGHTIAIPAGANSAVFEYADTNAGTPTLTVSAAGFASATQQESILPASSDAADIVVGRTLSAYFTSDVQNSQETITFTVYNQQANPITGVLLTDALEPGVTFVNASQQPDQSGQQLAWSLGTIQGYDRTSVSVTVSLANSGIVPLDAGAQAFATLNAAAISNATPAAILRQGSVDPNLLAATPDANSADPFIQEEAAALDYNAQNIFNFLHNDIGYNSYFGSVRGARGTLWSDAGDSLDVASLGVALMRASGIPAQYVSGTLSISQAQSLILSMFPAQDQTTGVILGGTPTADPANDPQLLSETESHYWFQFDAGSGLQNADPLMAGATIGQTFTQATGTFADVPATLRATTEVQVVAEITSLGAVALDLGGAADTTVLDQTFNDVDLVGRPISLGFNTSITGTGSIFSETTNTYGPYLALGDDAYDSTHGQIIEGQSFQEVLTNFPLSSSVLTGLFLNVTERGPQETPQTFSRTLVDRVGYAARQGLVSATISLPAGNAPALSDLDVYTLDVSAAAPDPQPTVELNAELQTDSAEIAALDDSAAEAQIAQTYGTDYGVDLTRILGNNLLAMSQLQTSTLALTSDVAAYYVNPRIVMISQQLASDSSGNPDGVSTAIDLVNDSLRVEAAPGQATVTTFFFNMARGYLENLNETNAVAALIPSGQMIQVDDTYDVFNAATAQGIGFTDVTSANLGALDALNIPADAKARITTDVMNGFAVLVPNQSVLLNGVPTIAWAETNLATGEYIGVNADGGHEGDFEFLAVVGEALEFETQVYKFLSPLAGIDTGEILSAAYQLAAGVGSQADAAAELKAEKTEAEKGYKEFMEGIEKSDEDEYLDALGEADIAGLVRDVESTVINESRKNLELEENAFNGALETTVARLTGQDPEVTGILSNPAPLSVLPANQASGSAVVASQLAPGAVQGSVQALSAAASGPLAADWSSNATSAFQATALNATSATVVAAGGATVGSGTVSLSSADLVAVDVSGTDSFSVTGAGSLSFYGSAESSLGVSGDWDNYSATVTGNVSLVLTTDGLTLNGQTLPAGTYTITTSSTTLSGSGSSTTPNFAGAVSITATGGTIDLGPANGSVTVASQSVDPNSGITFTGYTGNISVTASGNQMTDAVTLNGSAANVLTVSGAPAALSTTQDTPVSFQANVKASLADTYNITALAPAGWTVAVDNSGNITVTPAPGVQAGSYAIEVTAQSSTDPNLVTQTSVTINVTATAPGLNFSVTPDSQFTVPFNGAEVPSAFDAMLQNLGPGADTYDLTFANVPAGFTVLGSGTSDTVPAGQTGLLGLYLTPDAGDSIPPPGTLLTFMVTATSAANPAITQTVTVSFTMPAVSTVTLTSDPTQVNTLPGLGGTATLTLQNVGNVPINEALIATSSPGLTVSGLSTPVSLGVGASTTQALTLTPDANTPLNTTLEATITLGADETQSIEIPVLVVVPGATAIANAADAANQVGNAGLGNQLDNLGADLTNLVQTPASGVDLSQVIADLTSLIGLVSNDPFLSGFANGLITARTAFANATTAAQIDGAGTTLGTALDALAHAILDEAAYGFTLGLTDPDAVIQPGAPTTYTIVMQNTGTDTATYDFNVSGLPAGVIATFSQPSITLAPGASIPAGAATVTLSLSESGATLVPADFTITATAAEASEITLSTPGQLDLRPESLLVGAVVSNPPFTSAGGLVDVTAKILSVINEPRQESVSFTVTDATGHLLFADPAPVIVPLSAAVGLSTVDLGSFNTTGFVDGPDTITVTATDLSSQPLPSATGKGSVTIGSPVTATLTVSPTILPVGSGTVTNTLQINSSIPLPDPLTVDGQVATTAATSVALYQDAIDDLSLAYVAGPNGIDIVNVTNPDAPVDLGSFGTSDIVQGGLTVGRVDTIGGADYLIVGTTPQNSTGSVAPFSLLIYSLATPLSPQLVSNTSDFPDPLNGVDYGTGFLSDMVVEGNTVLVPTGYFYSFFGVVFEAQGGNVLDIDVSNPEAPVLSGVLFPGDNNSDSQTYQFAATIVNDQIAYIASSTATGGDTQNGVGRVLVINYSDPTDPTDLGEVDIPGTYQVLSVAVQGNQALVVGRTGGDDGPDTLGTMTLSVLDIADPSDPMLVGTTLVTNAQFPTNTSGVTKISAQPLGDGLFAISEAEVNGNPELLVVDPSDPNNIVVSYTPVTAYVNEMAVSGSLLYATSSTTSQGLTIFNIGQLETIPVTASVEVPNNTSVAIAPSSFTVSGAFNAALPLVVDGTNFDTLTWTGVLTNGAANVTVTWQSMVSNIAAGQVVPVTATASVAFVSQGTPRTVSLPSTAVSGVSFISLSPESQATQPGGTATYDVQLSNPTDAEVTYNVGVNGLNSGYVSQITVNSGDPAVTVPAGATVDVPLQISISEDAPAGDEPFSVEAADASTYTGADDSTAGDLVVAGPPVLQPDPIAHGVALTLTPAQATAGQDTSASYVVQVTNTGSGDDLFNLQISGLPDGVSSNLSQDDLDVPPGANNFRDVTLTLTADQGTTPGDYPFMVTATAINTPSTTGSVNGTLTVATEGVNVLLDPSSGVPGAIFDMTVVNTGTTTDTYTLAVAAPAALAATLAQDTVTLAPGANQVVPIATAAVTFADDGDLQLIATATSQTNASVVGSATADLTVPFTQGMTAQFTPATQTLPQPGAASFQLNVNDTGNAQDEYSATIIGTTGPITASLMGLDGQAVQSIPAFILPGLTTGALMLQTNTTSVATGTVTVRIASLSNPAITTDATATINPAVLVQTTTKVTSNLPNGSTYGQAVTLTATVSAGSAAPTAGSVDFFDTTTGADLGLGTFGGSSGLASTWTFTTGITMLNATSGDSITATYSPGSGFSGSDDTTTQVVKPLAVTLTGSRTYDGTTTAAASILTVSDKVGSDNVTLASGSAILASKNIGAQNIASAGTLSLGGTSARDYTLTGASGSVVISALAVTLTGSRTYDGTATATFGILTVSNKIAGDIVTVASGSATLASKNAGAENITSLGTLHLAGTSASNYTLSAAGGSVTINPAPLKITAISKTMTYGSALPALTLTYTGLVKGETAATFTTEPNIAPRLSTVSAASHAGRYAITVGSAADPNYVITYVPGTLTINPARLTITALSETITIGDPLPTLAATYKGLVNGDTPATFTAPPNTAPKLSTSAKATSPAGTYVIEVAAAYDPDYVITYVRGTLTIKAVAKQRRGAQS